MPIRARPRGQALAVQASACEMHQGPVVGLAPSRAATPQELYGRALHRHLKHLPAREIDFFINPRRVKMMERLIGDEISREGSSILNVACGPFAVEFYLKLNQARMESFDREPNLRALHQELINRGLIGQSEFSVADVAAYSSQRTYDVVLINDLLYAREVDFYALVPKYAAMVKPGGLLYFDIQDERAGPVWRAFGKDGRFRRYDLQEVERALTRENFVIEAMEPALGIKGGLDGLLRKGMWRLAKLANSYVFVARKRA